MSGTAAPLIAANWKMHKTVAEPRTSSTRFLPRDRRARGRPTSWSARRSPRSRRRSIARRRSAVKVAAQNMHEADSGAYTGEISASMLLEPASTAVILGHSERRQLFGETDEALAPRSPPRSRAGSSRSCASARPRTSARRGETEAGPAPPARGRPRAGGRSSSLPTVVIAYEPIWAIGTGQDRHARAGRRRRSGSSARSSPSATRTPPTQVRILYGGSVKPDNAAELLAQPDDRRRPGRRRQPRARGLRWRSAKPRVVSLPPGRRRAARTLRGAGDPRRLGARARLAPATRSRWPTRRSSTSSGRATRTRSCRRRAATSGCPTARWATPRSAT